MQLHPTREAVDIAATAIAVVTLGVVVTEPAIVAWGGALLVGIAVARAVTLLSVTQVRAAGFEMLWREPHRARRVARGQTVELAAEVRNRDTRAARYVNLRAITSPELVVEITPESGEVPAGGRLRVTVAVETPRVGRHAVHGLALEVRGGPGLFEIPLTFANPFGIEVLPAAYSAYTRSAQGGRSRRTAESGVPRMASGDGLELREIREHLPGDSFKRIAWKASARRGKLLVRDHEREDRDVVWLVLDASVELWAGEAGRSPLDLAIDEVATVAHAHLIKGDRVGLAICGARLLSLVPLGIGPTHATKIFAALTTGTATIDADRSDLDESDVAARVLEHLRPLDPRTAARQSGKNVERLARNLNKVFGRAPFDAVDVMGVSATDSLLRQYLSRFGVHTPARTSPDGVQTEGTLVNTFVRITRDRPRASLIYLWTPGPNPETRPALVATLERRPHHGLEVRWIPMKYEPSIPRTGDIGPAVAEAVAMRTRLAEKHGERALRRIGVRVDRVHLRVTPRKQRDPARADAAV